MLKSKDRRGWEKWELEWIYGGSHIAISEVIEGRIISKVQRKITDADRSNILEVIEQTIFENVINILNNTEERLQSLGIAVPGIVNEGTIIKCVNLGIKDYKIVDILNDKFMKYANENAKQEKFENLPLRIKLQNDAKCAAIAEKEYGVLQEYDSSIFLTLGTGIGGAAILNGKLLEGKCFSGYEFGHFTINVNGEQCKCGKKGCFELYGSMKKFKTMLKERLGLSQFVHSEQLLDLLKYDIALDKNDERIKQVIDEYIEHLAIGISNLINIFEPEAIGIGGSFAYFEDFLLEKLKNKIINGNLLFNPRNDIIIKSALLKNDAGIIGASML